jgi:hypothetical protein
LAASILSTVTGAVLLCASIPKRTFAVCFGRALRAQYHRLVRSRPTREIGETDYLRRMRIMLIVIGAVFTIFGILGFVTLARR